MQQQSGFGLGKIGQISITVKDLDRAVEFYRYRLGIKYVFAAPGMAFFDCEGISLMLAIPESEEFDHPASIIYFSVQDINLAYEELSAREVEFIGKPHLIVKMETYDLFMAFFRDSENNVLALMSRVNR